MNSFDYFVSVEPFDAICRWSRWTAIFSSLAKPRLKFRITLPRSPPILGSLVAPNTKIVSIKITANSPNPNCGTNDSPEPEQKFNCGKQITAFTSVLCVAGKGNAI
jgi:hypothetical protein